jgi:hypothetical protein
MYYKPITIVNDNSSIINKLETSLTDDTRVIIYDHYMFKAQATEPAVVKQILEAPLYGRLLALPKNIRRGWKGLPGTKTIAYWPIHNLRRK